MVQQPSLPANSSAKRRCVLICQHRSCVRQGAAAVLSAFQSAVPQGVLAVASDCMGQCASGPTVRIMPEGDWYCRIRESDVETIVTEHLESDRAVKRLLHPRFHSVDD